MRRAVILGNNPYRTEYYRRDFRSVFEDFGSNTGNQAINFGVACQMAKSATFLPWGAPAEQVRKSGDILVFPMANHLGKHTDLGRLAEQIDEIDLPVLGLGLGAQAASASHDIELTAGTAKWLETIIRRAPSDSPNLGVRGAYTASQLEKLGFPNCGLVTGCPSNFINPSRQISLQIENGFNRRPRQIAVCAGIPFIPDLARIEEELADIVSLTGGAYIVQHDISMVQIARNQFDAMNPQALDNCHQYIMPNRSVDEFKTWCRQHAYAFLDVPAWIDFLRRFDFVVGTRVHGAMLAIQAGVPAACIAHDSRTAELCETMGIPSIHYKEINGALTQHNIMDYFTFDAEKYEALRRQLHDNFMLIFSAADLEVSDEFKYA
jgi:hypothetical protein